MGQVGILGGVGIAAGSLVCIGLGAGTILGAAAVRSSRQKELEAILTRVGLAIASFCFVTTAFKLILYPVALGVSASTAYGMVATRLAIGTLFGGAAIASIVMNNLSF